MSNILYFIFFAIFVGIVAVLRFTRSAPVRRRLVTTLVLYVLFVHGVLAAARRDAWPFVTHGLFLERGDGQRPLSTVRLIAVDRSGREYRIDPNSWSPIHDRTLAIWWLVNSARLDPEGERRIMAFLLEKAETARRLRRAGARIGASRLLAFAAAPYWYSIESIPPPTDTPYVGLRVYLVTRVPARKLKDGSESARLLAEFGR